MRELLVRSISGIIYVALVVLSALYAPPEVFIILFCIFAFICLVELMPMIRLKQWLIYPVLPLSYFFLVWLEWPAEYKTIYNYIIYSLLAGTLLVNVYLIRDLVLLNRIPLFNTKKHIIALLYLIGSSLFLALIPMQIDQNDNIYYKPELLVGMFLIIWVNDSFAYLTGKNFGKHKLLERISPKKTIEGFLGGLFMALLAGVGLYYFVGGYELWQWVLLAFIVAFFGTIGDLIQSKIKRQAEVKDSGSIMPGHGGIFDRMDSIIFAAPFAYLFFTIINYVS
ncbi:MAG: phosphatidate cytidylyltransferase [Nonlabens sp.]|uniref:phosphatidate cytidylyltransferase n=1 Tax=Nonlabens sp. TaxID=1888209 RepID=UPI003EFAD84D